MGTLKGTHLQVQPGNCDGYENCDFGVYLDDDRAQARTTAEFVRGTGTRRTLPKTSHVPANILFIPDAPDPKVKLDASKLYREKHKQAKPADLLKQVQVSFGPPQTGTLIDIVLSQETVGGNTIVQVDLPTAKSAHKAPVKSRRKK